MPDATRRVSCCSAAWNNPSSWSCGVAGSVKVRLSLSWMLLKPRRSNTQRRDSVLCQMAAPLTPACYTPYRKRLPAALRSATPIAATVGTSLPQQRVPPGLLDVCPQLLHVAMEAWRAFSWPVRPTPAHLRKSCPIEETRCLDEVVREVLVLRGLRPFSSPRRRHRSGRPHSLLARGGQRSDACTPARRCADWSDCTVNRPPSKSSVAGDDPSFPALTVGEKPVALSSPSDGR
jgi:hypothetical protein